MGRFADVRNARLLVKRIFHGDARVELAAVRADVQSLRQLCEAQNHLVNEIHRMAVQGGLQNLSSEIEAVGVAQSEAVVFLNRGVRELGRRVEGASASPAGAQP